LSAFDAAADFTVSTAPAIGL